MSNTNDQALVSENIFATQPVQQTVTYGGPSGSQKSGLSGSHVTKIDFFTTVSTAYALNGIRLTFDNGQTFVMGGIGSTPNYSIDLSNDTISQAYLQVVKSSAFGSGTGIGAVYIETLRGQRVCTITDTPLSNPANWQVVAMPDTLEPARNMVLLGMGGTSGSAIDSLFFYFKTDALVSQGMAQVDYSGLAATPATPLNVANATVSNQTDTTQQMSVSFSESVTSTYTFSTTAGVSAGLKTTVNAGIPFVANGEVEVSATVSLDVTMGVSKAVSKSFAYTAELMVPAGATLQASAMASTYSISGSYSATFAEVWVHAGAVTRQVSGEIDGLSAYDVAVTYTTVS